MPLSHNYNMGYVAPHHDRSPGNPHHDRSPGNGYAYATYNTGRGSTTPATPPHRWYTGGVSHDTRQPPQEESHRTWQARKTGGYKSPMASNLRHDIMKRSAGIEKNHPVSPKTPPHTTFTSMVPDRERGRDRNTGTTYKTRTPSPTHATFESRLPRTTSPMAPPKRVFSTPPSRAYSEHTWRDEDKAKPYNTALPPPASPASPDRRPSMLWDGMSQFIIAPQAHEDRGKYCVVLDLDETLVYARDGPIQCRPGFKEMIRVLGQHCETVVWTAGERSYAKEVLKQLDTVGAIRHCIYRHHLWFDGQPGQVKDLRLLGRDPDRVLLVENTPDCLRKNATQAILVPDFRGKDEQGILTLLTVFLKDMVKSGLPVAQYLRSSPLITPREVTTNVGDTIICHTIGDSDANFQHRAPNQDSLPSYGKKYKSGF
eukprot:TRINITY_DN1100_c0_g1_i1.p1 TRINITY_DN1100_c0_g1~~TRINITY_DN1100_c0_g1_i1.p1  ORF type:complete len:427 (+),score=48.89 TRINITY_DN1100_c0_g1_i1:55-1335(+)